MAQYIDKSALTAELNKRLQERKSIKPSKEDDFGKGYLWGRGTEDKDVLYFIDTLEVKEVDLEKELESWRHNHFYGRRDIFANGEYLERVSQLDIAKHFFELGHIKAQKGETV